MEKDQIEQILKELLPNGNSKIEKKITVEGTYQTGAPTGNRLNSGTLRSQVFVCDKDDWESESSKAAAELYSDQRVFVQTGDDEWDVYSGEALPTEKGNKKPPRLLYRGKDLKKLIEDELKKIKSRKCSSSLGLVLTYPLQQIFYGAPGTGKSHEIKEKTQGCDVIRTTFHPDSDYSTFVGCYKPSMDDTDVNVVPVVVGKNVVFNNPATYKENRIVYKFIKQVFLKAYLKAWKKLTEYDIDRKFKVGSGQYVIIAISDNSITVEKVKDDDSGQKEDDNNKIVISKTELENIYNNPDNKKIEQSNNENQNSGDEIKQNNNETVQKTNADVNSGLKEKIKGIDPNSLDEAWTKIHNSFLIPQFLIIEEINRGNCAQIFGDIFQLLDRQNSGFSEYPIEADSDIRDAIAKAFKEEDEYKLSKDINVEGVVKNYTSNYGATLSKDIQEGRILLLPKNLFIWATMNTSDQSLFPIDSAFKRRWDWKYIKITNGYQKDANGQFVKDSAGNKIPLNWKIGVQDSGGNDFDWWLFLQKINDIIASMTSSADKQLGYFFCKADTDGIISEETFVSKVLFYLWNDVFKDYGFEDASLFRYDEVKDGKTETKDLTFPDFYNEDGDKVNTERVADFVQKVMDWNKDKEDKK